MSWLLKRFWDNESGATSTEYALIAVVVGVGVIASMQNMAEALIGLLESVETGFASVL